MKPLRLIMSAFGSYAGEEKIDFTKLGASGLYLITGETGSGKTTIFDAISFVLYGKASGDGRSDIQMLRSDFVEENAKTFVELEFISRDKQYTIRRTIKKRGQDADIIMPDGTVVSGDRNVKLKIAEIVGLDREQFAQIVMIAQNDFLRFLQSNTEDRLNILRRIFATDPLRQFQERLKEKAKEENQNLELILRDFNRHNVDVHRREEAFAEMELQTGKDREVLSEAEKLIAHYDKRKQVLFADINLSQELSNKFEELSGFQSAQKEHETRKKEIEALRTRTSLGETALRKVKPLADEESRTASGFDSAKADLAKARKEEDEAVKELEDVKKGIAALPPLEEAKTSFSILQKELETESEKFRRLTILKKDRNDILNKKDDLSETRNDLQAALETLKNLQPITLLQAELEKITMDIKDNEEKKEKLLSLNDDFTIIKNKQTALMGEQAAFEKVNSSFKNADTHYRNLEESFLLNQAGIIAGRLSDGKPCPVCGSLVHPQPAKLAENSVTESILNKARENRDNTHSERENKSSKCTSLHSETETLKMRFMTDSSAFFAGTEIEAIPSRLQDSINSVQKTIADLLKKKTITEENLSELKSKTEAESKKRDELIPKEASLKSEISALSNRFIADFTEFIPEIDWESSGTALTELYTNIEKNVKDLTIRRDSEKISIEKLTVNWETITKRKEKAESYFLSVKALINERTQYENKMSKLRDEARSAFIASIQINGFSDENAFIAALITEDELQNFKKKITDYTQYGEQLIRDIERLTRETIGKTKPDLEKLKLEKEANDMELLEQNKIRDDVITRLSNTENVLKELRRLASDFEKTEKAYSAVKQLSDTANGLLKFETYAQIAYFDRVIQAANLRLRLMSQDCYTLLRKTTSGDGRKSFGLDLEVLDAYTGKVRSSASLSGGESFITSLSLALGLSDIVQQSTGGISLDAMFIDEGFGSLDEDVLELAIRTLYGMTGTNRIIGIISHVSELRELIDRQILVEKTNKGSKIRISV